MIYIKIFIACCITFCNILQISANNKSEINVSARVVKSCKISADPIQIREYNNVQINIPISVTIVCTSATPYHLGVTHTRLRGTHNGGILKYRLYQDGISTPIGGKVGVNTYDNIGTGQEQTIRLHLIMPGGQDVPSDDYYGPMRLHIFY